MPSFSKMSAFPVGYFRTITQWLLRERRDVVARIATLSAEMQRIGFVTIKYEKVQEGESSKATYRRTGFEVTEGSSLARLVQAYIATGGNPMNICGFMHPDTTSMVPREDGSAAVTQDYPQGGAPAAKSVQYNDPLPEAAEAGDLRPKMSGYEGYRGGMIDHPGYIPGRLGSRMDRGSWDYTTVNRVMHDTRKWANKEIKTRLQDKEWRIIKLSDCWEQLRLEREEVLMEAFGGLLVDMPDLDEAKFDPRRLAQVIIAEMYGLLFDVGESGIPQGFKPSPTLGFLTFAFEDEPGDGVGLMG
jgi:hypothetical protein